MPFVKGFNGWTGKKHSLETRKRMSQSHIGIKPTLEVRKRLSLLKTGKPKPKNAYKFPFGEKHPCWRGGIARRKYPSIWNDNLKALIRERDGNRCQLCDAEKILVVHHIDYNKHNCSPNNLVTLCRKCHPKTNFNIDKWKEYFMNQSDECKEFLINLLV